MNTEEIWKIIDERTNGVAEDFLNNGGIVAVQFGGMNVDIAMYMDKDEAIEDIIDNIMLGRMVYVFYKTGDKIEHAVYYIDDDECYDEYEYEEELEDIKRDIEEMFGRSDANDGGGKQ